MRYPTERDLRQRYSERLAHLADRESAAWREYLAATRADDSVAYEQGEPVAWRRLRRTLAELGSERRRAELELHRGLAEARGASRAS